MKNRHRNRSIILTISLTGAIWLTLASCTTKSISPLYSNHLPTIDSIRFVNERDSVEVGDSLAIRCFASDLDGDIPEIIWGCSAGRFVPTTGSLTRWIPPAAPAAYEIWVRAIDPYDTTLTSFTVTVVPRDFLNARPVIESLTVDRDSVRVEGTVRVVCVASDADGDSLTYSWSKTNGQFRDSGPQIRWIAPRTIEVCTLSVDVSDGKTYATQSVQVVVVPDTTVLYSADFTHDEVTGRWTVDGLLAGLGERQGFAELEWDSLNHAMAVVARSDYGTYGYKLNGMTMAGGTYRVKVFDPTRQYARLAILPKYIDQNNYILIGISAVGGGWQVVKCIDGVTQEINHGWDTFPLDAPIEFVYHEANGQASAVVGGLSLGGWATMAPFSNSPTPVGIAVSVASDVAPVLFDDFLMTIP